MQVDFRFEPMQRVRIIAYDLNFDGRIIWCEYSGKRMYNVEYAADGKIERGVFYEDQLKEI